MYTIHKGNASLWINTCSCRVPKNVCPFFKNLLPSCLCLLSFSLSPDSVTNWYHSYLFQSYMWTSLLIWHPVVNNTSMGILWICEVRTTLHINVVFKQSFEKYVHFIGYNIYQAVFLGKFRITIWWPLRDVQSDGDSSWLIEISLVKFIYWQILHECIPLFLEYGKS